MFSFIVSLLLLQVVGLSYAQWNYNVQGADWEDICANGVSQSPIAVSHDNCLWDEGLAYIHFNYHPMHGDFTVSDYGIKFTPDGNGPKSTISGGGLNGVYELAQFHFHWGNGSAQWGSEHVMDGQAGAVELHLVHFNRKYGTLGDAVLKSDGLAVVGFIIYPGTHDKMVEDYLEVDLVPLFGELCTKDRIPGNVQFNNQNCNDNLNFFRYPGSLTTPGCYETVTWSVLGDKFGIAQAGLEAFWAVSATFPASEFGYGNFREVMDLNDRVVRSTDSSCGEPVLPNPTVLPNPEENFCLTSCANRRNPRDHYADPTNCHRYWQCDFFNETFATGHLRDCPPETFWHDEVLSCMPEGSTPCEDSCRDEATASRGCYAVPDSCNGYMVCANSASYGQCCPVGTLFVEETCTCDNDDLETCTDECVMPSPSRTTTEEPVRQIDERTCIDSYGVTLQSIEGRPGFYVSIDTSDDSNLIRTERPCAPGTLFTLAGCACSLFTDAPEFSADQCLLWLPFDGDSNDHSVHNFETFVYGSGNSLDQSSFTFGSGSFSSTGNHLEVPGLKTADFKKGASFCFFYRCANDSNCNNGGLLSNNNHNSLADYSVIMAKSTDGFSSLMKFSNPNSEARVDVGHFEDWNHVCTTYNGNQMNVFSDAESAGSGAATGDVAIGHCPYTVGSDQFFGNFNGFIDEVLVCPFAFSQTDVEAHFNGDYEHFFNNGFLPQPATQLGKGW